MKIIVAALVLCVAVIYKFGIAYGTESARDFLVLSEGEDGGLEFIGALQMHARERGYVSVYVDFIKSVALLNAP
ncbi:MULTISPECIES: hypothetical protein [Burkholderia]|uniref:hypothetical protein n=1 Tax=Burkholderia TaxID=32008 RepID=UPI0015827975|nr:MULTISPECIES: hypothetical protein [Burkholderia]